MQKTSKLIVGIDDLETKRKEYISEWDYEKNEIQPNEISYKSKKKVWWKCRENHSYKLGIDRKIKSQYSMCPECKTNFWDYEKNNNSMENMYEKDKTKAYWWKCEKNHSFYGIQCDEVYCPVCLREAPFDALTEEIPDILEQFTLTPYENSIYILLKEYNMSSTDYYEYTDIRSLKTKQKRHKIEHFGIKILESDFNLLTRENYIDFSLFDEIFRRNNPPIGPKRTGCLFDSFFYYCIYSRIIRFARDVEKKEGIVDLSKEFKKQLLIDILDYAWDIDGFYKSLDSMFEWKQDVILCYLKDSIEKEEKFLEDSNELEGLAFALTKIQLEKEKKLLAELSDVDKWNKHFSDYRIIKIYMRNANTIKRRVDLCKAIVTKPEWLRCLSDYSWNSLNVLSISKVINKHSGVDTLLGGYEPEVIEQKINDTYYNFDLNMKKMKETDSEEFKKYLSDFAEKNNYVEIKNLNSCRAVSGIYIMVLDKYKRVYIGIAEDLTKRIKEHWHKDRKPLGKLIFGDKEKSVLSINSFGALDTTRIFVKLMPYEDASNEEYRAVREFDPKYTLNRIHGGLVKDRIEILEH